MTYKPKSKIGLGGVALGNGFQQHPDDQCLQTMEAAWDAGIRFFDTSPWYGLGISERRMGMFLKDKPKEDYTISSKIGRILKPHANFSQEGLLWKGQMNFGYTYDYTAEGARKSIEDSLQRLGVPALDVVFIHDLSPDNGDMKNNWQDYYKIALKGAMPELSKMRDEGLIKGWGLGVNTLTPILQTLADANPDIFLSACQYSLIEHEELLNLVFPIVQQRDISIVVGAPLCAGFLAGKDRYLYDGTIPKAAAEKLEKLKAHAKTYQVDLLDAALQFAGAAEQVSAVIPGAHTPMQVQQNVEAFKVHIPEEFWIALKKDLLIAEHAAIPNS